MTGPEQDEDFEQYLRQRTVLPARLAKADRLEPPPELDRIVLAHAKEAIHASDVPRFYRRTRWALPVGLAATVVMAFALFLHMRETVVTSPPIAAAAPVRTLNQTRELTPAPRAPASESEQRSRVGPAYARTTQESARAFAPSKKAAGAEPKAHVQQLQSAPVSGMGLAPYEARASANAPVAKASAPTAPPLAESASVNVPLPTVSIDAATDSALLTPADWRAKIAKLRAEGKIAAADREQAAFLKAYPGERPLSEYVQ